MQRTCEQDDEDEEKYTLSLSIINFLRASSGVDKMTRYMKGKTDVFKKILQNEDRYSSKMIKHIPIDIENTWFGREMHVLKECVYGVDGLEPYSDVSFRVISRMADILMMRHSYKMFEIKEEST